MNPLVASRLSDDDGVDIEDDAGDSDDERWWL